MLTKCLSFLLDYTDSQGCGLGRCEWFCWTGALWCHLLLHFLSCFSWTFIYFLGAILSVSVLVLSTGAQFALSRDLSGQ